MKWRRRAGVIASAIPDGASVLDLGGGFCYLAKLLPGSRYASIDVEPWTDATIVGDLNGEAWPDAGRWEVIVAQGVIEYMTYAGEFLERIKKYAWPRSVLIAIYRTGEPNGKRVNFMTFEELKLTMKATGWKVVFERALTSTERIFYCARA